MKSGSPSRGGLKHRLARIVLASTGVVAAPSAVLADASGRTSDDVASDDDVADADVQSTLASIANVGDPAVAADRFGGLLVRMNAFDATRTAAVAALHPDAGVRRALAVALAAPFPLVGAGFVLDHLAVDRDLDVRGAAQDARLARGYLVIAKR